MSLDLNKIRAGMYILRPSEGLAENEDLDFASRVLVIGTIASKHGEIMKISVKKLTDLTTEYFSSVAFVRRCKVLPLQKDDMFSLDYGDSMFVVKSIYVEHGLLNILALNSYGTGTHFGYENNIKIMTML